jgi:hypothetical protein
MRYRYDTQESFSKAFTRFHGVAPSKIGQKQARIFHPLVINVTVQGGFDMGWKITNDFHLVDWKDFEGNDDEKYKKIVAWAGQARATNPNVFDALTEWILDDSEWTKDKLAENEQILMQGVFARFKEQNARLRMYLRKIEPSGVVNIPVFKALDDFDMLLSGIASKEDDWRLSDAASGIFTDFSSMQERSVREQVAGGKTGRHGTDTTPIFGFINHLKNCDAQVQWCLFMPDVVKNQQSGFQVDSFDYKHMPAMRFIGWEEVENFDNPDGVKERFIKLDALNEYRFGFNYDVILTHHYGRGVDVEPWHGFWGRFMKADTPVPEGFLHFDFTHDYQGDAGLPYQSKFAFATFTGDVDAMHNNEGTDGGRLYDVTRNIILGQGRAIPYPEKYWTAEVFLNGFDKPSTAYMFSAGWGGGEG